MSERYEVQDSTVGHGYVALYALNDTLAGQRVITVQTEDDMLAIGAALDEWRAARAQGAVPAEGHHDG